MQVNPSRDTEQHARAFLMEPDSVVESRLISSICADLVQAGHKPLPCDAFVEWGWVEHDLIHIFHSQATKCVEFQPGGFITEYDV
jgi:hypothetical protein